MFRDLLDVAHQAVESYNGSGKDAAEHTYLLFLARAAEASSAFETLYSSGHEQDAGSVLRTVCELYIELRYILLEDAHLARYVDFAAIQNNKLANSYTRIFPGRTLDDYWKQFYEGQRSLLALLYPDWQALKAQHETDVAAARAKHNYGPAWADERDPDTGKDRRISTERKAQLVDKRAQESASKAERDATLAYEIAFRFGSLSVHPSISSLHRRVEHTAPGEATISSKPAEPTSSLTLFFCAMFLMKIFDYVNDRLELGREAALRKADDFFQRALRGEVAV